MPSSVMRLTWWDDEERGTEEMEERQKAKETETENTKQSEKR